MNKVLVSVVVIFFNEREYIAKAIDSIIDQTYDNIEVLLVDDCSTDGSDLVARDYAEKYDNIRYYRNETNSGPACSRNCGIRNAKGEYVAFLDGDDYAVPERISIQAEYLDQHEDVIAVSGGLRSFTTEGGEYEDLIFDIDDKDLRSRMLFENLFAQPAAMIRRSLFSEHGLLQNEKYRSSQDYDYWLRCLKYGNLHIVPQVLIYYRVHESKSKTFVSRNVKQYDEWMLEIISNGWNACGIDLDEKMVNYVYRTVGSGRYIWRFNDLCMYERLNRIVRSARLPKEEIETVIAVHKELFFRYLLYWMPVRVAKRLLKR